MKTILKNDWDRRDVVRLLQSTEENIGIELGVAKGGFSKDLIETRYFKKFFGIDRYLDNHDNLEYVEAIKHVGLNENYCLIKMTFKEALGIFPDNYFDFIYIDGYAHTGQLGGETIRDWYYKLKIGGVLSGDDYSDRWSATKNIVNKFAQANDFDLYVTGTRSDSQDTFAQSPSWAIIKSGDMPVSVSSVDIRKAKLVDTLTITKRNLLKKIRNAI